MKNILLKELTLDAAEEIVELMCLSTLNVNCRVEKGMSPQTVDCIIKLESYTGSFTVRYEAGMYMFEFVGDDEKLTFELIDNTLTDMVIR